MPPLTERKCKGKALVTGSRQRRGSAFSEGWQQWTLLWSQMPQPGNAFWGKAQMLLPSAKSEHSHDIWNTRSCSSVRSEAWLFLHSSPVGPPSTKLEDILRQTSERTPQPKTRSFKQGEKHFTFHWIHGYLLLKRLDPKTLRVPKLGSFSLSQLAFK